MTLRNEIFEGIAAYKGVKEALGDTPRDRYADAMARAARIPVDEYNERKRARQRAIARGRPPMGGVMPQALASTAMPGTPTTALPATPMPTAPVAFTPTARPAQATPGILNYNYRRGGKVESDPLRDAVDRNTNSQGLELIERDLDKPQLKRPSSDQYMREKGYPSRKDVPKFQRGGAVKKKFDPEGEGYDDESAEWEDVRPEMNAEDGKMHGMSRVPRTGLQLKGRQHPTWDKAIETDRRLGYGLEMRDGRYYTQPFKQYADGGMVDGAADENEADLIVRSLMSRDIGEPDAPPAPDFAEDRAAHRINQQVGEPWGVTGPSSEYQTRGARDKLSNEQSLSEAQAMDTTRMQESAPVAKGRSRLQRATDWMMPDPAAMGQARNRRKLRREINRNEPGLTEELTDSELRQREEKTAGLRGQLEQSAAYGTPEAPSNVGALIPDAPSLGGVPAALSSVINLEGFKSPGADPRGNVVIGAKPAAPGADTTSVARGEINETGGTPEGEAPAGPYPVPPQVEPTPVPGPNTAQMMSPESAAAAAVAPNTRQPNQTPGPAARPVPGPGSTVVAQGSNGPTVPQTGPTGTTAAPAPPAGSASANRPSTAPKPRPALNVQSRTQAYDPVLDANDPSNVRPVDAGGRAFSPQEIQTVLAGAATLAPPDPATAMTQLGNGGVTRQNFNAYVQHHNQGGAFSPGEAMLVGMLSDYKMLLSQGHVDQANKMAFGLIQAASIEAASYGYVARDQFKMGDYKGALENAVAGANYVPDGVTFKVGPDGKTLVAMNGQGQVTGQAAVTPQQLMGMITGLASGQLIWQALQTSAAALTKPDKNAEGRALSNQIKRNSLLLQERRLAKPTGGGGGSAMSPAAAEAAARLAQLGGRAPVAAAAPRAQGSDDSNEDPGAAVVAGERFDDD